MSTEHRAEGYGLHLDLHRVLRLGLLSVQELDGHDDLCFTLEKHHLGMERDEQQKL